MRDRVFDPEHAPTVSVVMPVYNSEKYLDEAMESILAQTFQDFEVIAVDDGSTDRSGVILDGYAETDPRIRVIHQMNQGISATRNRGMAEARGKYIAVMDSDDVCIPERFEKQVAFLEEHPEVGLCGTRCAFFGDLGEYMGAMPALRPEVVRCRLIFLPTLSHTSVMMRRSLVVGESLVYDTEFVVAEDYELYTRFLLHSEIANLPDVLMRIRTHHTSTTRRIAEGNDRKMLEVYRKALPNLGLAPSEDDLEMHLRIAVCRSDKSREYIESAERWLLNILETNDRFGFHESGALRDVLFERWTTVCASGYEHGLWTLRRYVRSPLYNGCAGLSKFLLKFAARCLLKRQSLRIWKMRRSAC